jgi:hypothetical protein
MVDVGEGIILIFAIILLFIGQFPYKFSARSTNAFALLFIKSSDAVFLRGSVCKCSNVKAWCFLDLAALQSSWKI